MKHFWFSVCLLLVSMGVKAQILTADVHWHHRTIEVPGPREKGGQLYSDADGFIYLLQSRQLLRFDGLSWSKYYQRTQKPTYSALAFFQGNLWVGTREGMLLRAQHDSLLPYPLEEGWPQKPITAMCATADWLFMATAGEGLYAYNGQRLLLIDEEDGLPDPMVSSLALHGKEVLAGTDMGIVAISIGENYKKKMRVLSTEPLVSAMHVSASYWWLGFQSGELGVLRQGEVTYLPQGDDDPIHKMIQVGEDWWFSDKAGHLYTYEGSKLQTRRLLLKHADRTLRISDMLEGQNGMIWLSTNEGIRLIHPEWELLPFPTPEAQIQALGQLGDGTLVAGTNKGCYRLDVRNGWQLVDGSSTSFNVLCLTEDGAGGLWAGTFGEGVFSINPKGRLLGIGGSSKTSNYNTNVFSIEKAPSPNTWYLGTLGGIYVLERLKTKTNVRPFHHDHGPGQFYIFDLLHDKQGALWIATDGKGIFSYQNGQFKPLMAGADHRALIISALARGSDGAMWATSPQGQLFKARNGQWKSYSIPFESSIALLQPTPAGNVLLGSQNGLSFFIPAQNLVLSLDKMYDLPGLTFTANALYQKGNQLWLGANGLILKTNIAALDKLHPPHVKLSAPFSLRQNQPALMDPSFKANDNDLRFSFHIPWYYDPGMLYIRYKLHGLHSRWMETEKRDIFLQGLEPGNYEMEVQVSLHSDFRSFNSARRSFHIRQPFYATWWFVLLVSALMLLILRQLMHWREQRKLLQDRAEKERIRAQYEILKSQISPHFLFNAFNTLSQLIEMDPPKAGKYVDQLAELFRKVLHFRDQQVIALSEEMALVNAYVHLQQQRFENRFQVTVNLPAACETMLVIPMSVQLLIENAVKHNVITSAHPLQIDVYVEGQRLVVRNRLQPKKSSEPSTGYGLSSLQTRYAQDFNQTIEVTRTQAYFIVSIPLLNPQS